MEYWTSGLCSCFSDCGICCYGCLCPCCLYGDNVNKINGSSFCGACCIYCTLTACSLCCLVHMGTRESLRRRYNLVEDCNDCAATTFCPLCAICQEARELKYRETTTRGGTTIVVQPHNFNA